jgi:NinB protein
MSIPAQAFTWNGKAMVPRHSRLAEQSFTSGHTYRLGIVAEQEQGRTTEQNSKMWAMLNDISEQVDHQGRKYSADEWKAIFLYACGYQVKFLPDLEGRAFVPYFHSSRKLLKREFIELLEFIQAWGTEHNIRFGDQRDDEGGC